MGNDGSRATSAAGSALLRLMGVDLSAPSTQKLLGKLDQYRRNFRIELPQSYRNPTLAMNGGFEIRFTADPPKIRTNADGRPEAIPGMAHANGQYVDILDARAKQHIRVAAQ